MRPAPRAERWARPPFSSNRTSGGQRPNFSPPSRVESARAACPAATLVALRSASAWGSVSSAGTGLPYGAIGPAGIPPGKRRPARHRTTSAGRCHQRRRAPRDTEADGPGGSGPAAWGRLRFSPVALEGVRHHALVLDMDPGLAGRDAELPAPFPRCRSSTRHQRPTGETGPSATKSTMRSAVRVTRTTSGAPSPVTSVESDSRCPGARRHATPGARRS